MVWGKYLSKISTYPTYWQSKVKHCSVNAFWPPSITDIIDRDEARLLFIVWNEDVCLLYSSCSCFEYKFNYFCEERDCCLVTTFSLKSCWNHLKINLVNMSTTDVPTCLLKWSENTRIWCRLSAGQRFYATRGFARHWVCLTWPSFHELWLWVPKILVLSVALLRVCFRSFADNKLHVSDVPTASMGSRPA